LHPDGRSEHLTAAAEAIMVEDRRAAAASMVRMVEELKAQYREDDLLRGLSKAFTALAAPTLDSETLLAALRLLTGHIRDRQRFGELPSPARAGVDLLLSILTIRPGSAEAGAFIELMDGLADAGLDRFLHDEDDGRVASRGDSAHAEIAQARIAAHTARDHRRRDSETTMAALHSRTAVIFRERKTLDAPGFVALHLQPPDGVSIKNRAYPTAVSDGLAALAKRSRGVTSDVADQVDVDQLVNFLLPARLQDKIRDEGLSQLTVVPDGDLWFVPWRASRLLAGVDVRLMPSLPNAPPPASHPIRSVLAIVDSQAPGADAVITSLHAARDRGTLQITQADDLPTDEHDHDLLLFFGHGAGRGLSYGLLTPRGSRTALDLTRCRNIRQGLLAACWSAGSPLQGSQISVPAALLASGMNPVVGGTWPLPGVETGQVVARAIAHLESAMDLPTAVRRALDEVPVSRDCGWGVAVFGT
jgi:hypothetical protein